MFTKVAVVSLLVAAGPVAAAAGTPAQTEIVTADEIPAAARQTLQAKAGKHRIHEYERNTYRSGAVSYDVRFHTLTTGDTEVEVSPRGNVVGVYRRLEEPVGSGP